MTTPDSIKRRLDAANNEAPDTLAQWLRKHAIDPFADQMLGCADELDGLQSALSTAEQERDAALAAVGVLKREARDFEPQADYLMAVTAMECAKIADKFKNDTGSHLATAAAGEIACRIREYAHQVSASSLIAEREVMRKVVEAASEFCDGKMLLGIGALNLVEALQELAALRQSSVEAKND